MIFTRSFEYDMVLNKHIGTPIVSNNSTAWEKHQFLQFLFLL